MIKIGMKSKLRGQAYSVQQMYTMRCDKIKIPLKRDAAAPKKTY